MMDYIYEKKTLVLALSSALVLTACGGGGGGGGSDSSPSSPVVDTSTPSSSETSNNQGDYSSQDNSQDVREEAATESLTPNNSTEVNLTDKVTSSESVNTVVPTEPTQPSIADTSGADSTAPAVPIVSKAKISMQGIESKNYVGSASIGSRHLDAQRQACALGGVEENSELTKIATQHAQYIQHVFANSEPRVFNAHSEANLDEASNWTGGNNPYFTGVSFKERLINAGYSNLGHGVAENISRISYYSSVGQVVSPQYAAQSMVKALLSAPYHLRLLVSPTLSQTGSGMVAYKPYGKNPNLNQGYVFVNASSADQNTRKRTVEGVFTYPCDNVVGTNTALYNESPNPVAGTGRNLATDPIGQPIYINVPSAETIKVSNIQFRDLKRGVTVPVDLLDASNDPHKGTGHQLPENEAFILPITDGLKSCEASYKQGQNCGLYGNTPYEVSFEVLVDNTTLKTKSFTFTTGDVN